MALSIASIKRDFAKHRGKAAFLAVLAVIMVVFMVKAWFDMAPHHAEAESPANSNSASAAEQTPASVAEADERLKHSRDLWNVLRETRGMDASVAFTFDSSYYSLDPKRPMVAEAPEVVDKTQSTAPVEDFAEEKRLRLAQLREQARALIIRSTVVGHGNKPVAVINDQILSEGDHILGFEITEIKAREVDFKKDGITLAVKMSEDARGE